MIRKILFWSHLTAGVAAGIVILMMSVTGVLLTYEKQMVEWAERSLHGVPPGDSPPLPTSVLVNKAKESGTARFGAFVPSQVVWKSDPGAPVQIRAGRDQRLYLDAYEGTVLSEGFPRLESFLSSVRGWHRWFNLTGDDRRPGRQFTGAANLAFLFVLVSGVFLWLPRRRTWRQFKQVLFFRRGLRSKARDFNWHNVIGVWSLVPLIVVVASAVPISYGWAGDFVAWLTAETETASAPPGNQTVRFASLRPSEPGTPPSGLKTDTPNVNAAMGTAMHFGSDWREITLSLPSQPVESLTVQVYDGYRGQPQLRETLTIDAVTGSLVNRATFEAQPRSRRARSFLRFAHTGEYWGLVGQTIAGLVSLASVALVYTGVSLALRRAASAIRRRSG